MINLDSSVLLSYFQAKNAVESVHFNPDAIDCHQSMSPSAVVSRKIPKSIVFVFRSAARHAA